MKLRNLLPVLVLAACSSGPSKEESMRIWTSASTAASSARVRAVADAQTVAPAAVTLDFTGPCSLGGTVSVSGSHDGDATSNQATFDLSTSFVACQEAQGTLDGSVQWTSTASGAGFSASMTGDLDWTDGNGSASCSIDVQMAVSAAGFSYTGSICGYDVTTELTLQP